MSDSETLTDANGQYAFTGLRAGNYTVEISGFDEDDVAFGSTATTAELAVGESKVVPFEGTYLRTAAITGQVSVEGVGLENVTVSLQGRDEERTATTNSAGQYTFSELRSGDYSVGITNPDTDEYGFDVTSKTVTIAHGETASVPFDGILLRTASIMGTVTVEGVGLENVTITIQGEGAELESMTNAAGQFSFTKLHAGDYSVGLTGFDDDLYGFDVTTATVTVALQETATVPFTGIMLRTAGIQGTITVENHPIPGVTVTVTGGPKDEEHTRVTDDAGHYMVGELHAGDYAVAISDFDANEYEFEATTQNVSVGLRETATVAFQGDLLRTAGISGRVSVEGTGLDGITVTLSGDADKTFMTADGGQYAFAGLAAGDYTVEIEGWDSDAYIFDMASADLTVAEDAEVIQNFEGMHTRTASVSGYLFLDEINANGMHDEGEPALAMTPEMMAALTAAKLPGVPLLLQGPGVNDVQYGFTNADGSYAFENLMAGSYRVLVNLDAPGLSEAISHFGFRFSGELTGQVISVAAAEAAMVNFPFRIVMQTIVTGAVMGHGDVTGLPVAGVSLAMFPTVEAADDGEPMLGTATTNEMGAATFHFRRDANLGPGGHGTDNLVFVKVTGTGHPDLVVSDNAHIEIEYPAIARVHQDVSPDNLATAAKLLNIRANFQWWIKSDKDAKDGDQFLENWNVVIGADTIATGSDGKGSYSGIVPLGDMPASIMVMADSTQADSLTMKEEWEQSDALSYTHNPLAHPAMNSAEMNDLGPIYITFTTQRLVLGVYREADDHEGYSDYRSALPRGDHRPHADVAKEMNIELLARDSRNRLRRYEWDPDKNGDFQKEGYKSPGSDGLVTFTGIPADAELTVRYHVGSSARVQVDYGYDEIETFGDDLVDFGSSVGAFGDMSGAGPEVRICSASEMTDDDYCATFGYQWKTGMVYGSVGTQKDHKVAVEPETGHGATGDDTKTDKNGKYSITGLRDGEYSATASKQGDYTVDGAPTKKGLAVYHDEWADEEDEDKADSAWVGGRAQRMASWTTTRGGLAIMGYVANDGDGNNLVRGDEGTAGLTVNLLTNVKFYGASDGAARNGKIKSATTAATTETAGNGFYSFSGLNNKTKYWVQVIAGGDAGGYLSLSARNPNLAGGSSGLSAQRYPNLPEESTYLKPTWDRGNHRAGNTAVSITVGTVTATLHNFGLVYTDGTVAGRVNNISGSNRNIDVRITSNLDDNDLWERATSANGEFSVEDLMEGTYTAVIEDAGYEPPCMNAKGDKADDDAVDANGDCLNAAATSLTRTTEGRADYENLGTLYVYDARESGSDELTELTVNGIQSIGGTAANLAAGVSAPAQSGSTTEVTGLSADPITFAPGTVTVTAKVSSDAKYSVMKGTDVCAGGECELDFNKTGSGETTAKSTTLTVMVTAENSYDDHAYTFSVSRANPVGYDIEARDVFVNGDRQTGIFGTSTERALQAATGADANNSAKISFALDELGSGDDVFCAQDVEVRLHNSGDVVSADEATDDDSCENNQYTLTAGPDGTMYRVTIESQDGETEDYYLNLRRGAVNEAPEVSTPIDDQSVMVGADVTVDVAGNFTDAEDDADLDFEAESSDATTATVSVNGSVVTITGVAAGTATITVTATDPDDASISDEFMVAVNAANQDPTVATAIPDQSVEVGADVTVDVSSNFSDADNDNLTFSAASSDATMATVAVNGSMVTVTGVAAGSATITVTADDGNGGTVDDAFDVTVSAANQDPTVSTPIPDQSVEAGADVTVDAANHFSDADNDNLTFTAASSDATMATVAVNGSMVTVTGVAAGSATITVTADDGNGGTVDDAFDVAVSAANQDPTESTAMPDHSIVVGADVTVDLSSYWSDPDNDELSFTVASSDDSVATASLNGSMVTVTGVAAGSATITVTADDGNGGSGDGAFDVAVSAANQDPTVSTPIADQSVEVGADVTVDVSSNFSDADDDNLTYTAASSDATMATVAVNGSMVTVTGVAVGSPTITVTADDGNGGTVDDAFDVTVAPTSPAVVVSISEATVREGTERDYTVRLATQPTGGDVTVAISVAAPTGATDADVSHVTTSRSSLTFNATNWDNARTVTILVGDDADEVTEMAEVTHAPSGGNYAGVANAVIAVTAEDDDVVSGAAIMAQASIDVEEGDTTELMVRLSAEPTADVTVSATLEPASGVATIESGASLTFDTLNWNTPQGITITGDDDADPVDTVATLTLAALGGGYGDAEDIMVEVNVNDDEEATIRTDNDLTSAQVIEGGNFTYNLTLSAPPPAGQTVYVNLAVNGPASVSPTQAEFTSTTANNQVLVTVTALSDSDSDDETVTISHSVDASVGSGYESAAAPANISVTVKDDETAGIVVHPTALSVVEGGTATYTVRLTTAPSTGETVTINLAGTGVNLGGTTLTFTEGDFATAQTVTVTGHIGASSGMVVHTVTSTGGDTDYAGVTASTVTITITEPSE